MSGHGLGDVLDKSRTFGDLREPALEMGQLRLGDAFDAEPAPRKGAERDIGDRELIAFDEAPVRQLRFGDLPDLGFRVGIFLDRDHVAFSGGVRTRAQNTGRSTGCSVDSVQSSQRSTPVRAFGACG